MDGLKEFLDSSTIHGLSHIAKNRRLLRLLWIVVVLAGFTGAGLLIREALNNWSQAPVSTTTEILPISQVKFPLVTVCPPLNTFTSLSLDILNADLKHFDNKSRALVLQKVPQAAYDDSDFEDRFAEFESFKEKDKYRNWYNGQSEISYPFRSGISVYYQHTTFALSGSVQTPYFGEEFEESRFRRYFQYKISIRVPESISNSTEIRLLLEIEYDIEIRDYETLRIGGPEKDIRLDEKENNYILNVSMVGFESVLVTFYRRIKRSELEVWDSKRNTGMSLSWKFEYSTWEETMPYYPHSSYIKIANIIHEGYDVRSLWENVRHPRNLLFLSKDSNNFPKCDRNRARGILESRHIFSLYKEVKKHYIEVPSDPLYLDIKDETLEEAGRIYYYLIHCPDNIEKGLGIKKFYDDLIRDQSLKTIIMTLGRISATARTKKLASEKRGADILFSHLAEVARLKSRTIDLLTHGYKEISKTDVLGDYYESIKALHVSHN